MSKKLLRVAGAGSMGIGLLVAGAAYAAVPTLSQTSVTIGIGQSAAVTSSNGNVYMLSNSDGTVVSVVMNGNQITVTGQGLGGALLTICAVGTASDCTSLNVGVQTARVAGLSFSPNNFSLPIGSSQAVAVSGGSGTYRISANSSSSIASATLSSSTLAVSGATAGSAAITVCDSANLCGTVSVTVTNGATSNQAVTFNPANPTLAVGQTITVALSGNATSFVILTNTNPDIVQASMSGAAAALSLTGVKSGTDSLVICGVGGDCSSFSLTVTGSGSATAATSTATASTTTQTTAPALTQSGTVAVNASLVAQIQALQNTVAQILTQLQSVQAQLAQLKAQVSAGASVSANASVSSGASGTFTGFLSLNSKGAEVTLLQQKLTALGFYSGDITGFYGLLTQQAVMKYQTAHGITATGYVGPSTRAALNSGS